MTRDRRDVRVALLVTLLAAGCSSPTKDEPRGPVFHGRVDLLFVVGNSGGMGPSQQLFAREAARLVVELASPRCVDGLGVALPEQPASPLDPCPAGSSRERVVAADMNVGVISASLGGVGSDACPAAETVSCAGGVTNLSQDDRAHLLARRDPCTSEAVPTWQGLGFLAWDPAQARTPSGESVLGDPAGAVGLAPAVRDLVLGVGARGCSYPMPLEAAYRFLVDPDPYDSISLVSGRSVPTGTDTALLDQRRAFLRPDSLLLVVFLGEGDDCSTRAYSQFYFALQQRNPANAAVAFRLPRARSECQVDPNDPCCKSCGQSPGTCPPDATCGVPSLTEAEDSLALRCWEQKRRFGIDFQYGLDRYVAGFTASEVPDRAGSMVTNPIFADLEPGDALRGPRDARLVHVAAFAGVPWQDLAVDPADPSGGFRDSVGMAAAEVAGHSRWEVTVGDLAAWVAPLDPHMVESPDARTGTNPITGTDLAPPGSAFDADPICGHEFTAGAIPEGLQYACAFDLTAPIDCTVTSPCACVDPANDLPVCGPNGGTFPIFQVRGGARPARRVLTLLQGLGAQATPASACPANGLADSDPAWGFRPGVDAVLRDAAAAMEL